MDFQADELIIFEWFVCETNIARQMTMPIFLKEKCVSNMV